MQYLGDILKNATIRGSFNTRTAAGVPITIAGSAVLSVYKDADVAQTTTGVTITPDFDGVTGHHLFAVATTDAFYTTGSDFRIVITTGTVDGVSVVGTEVGSFSLQNRNIQANVTQIAGQTANAAGAVTFPAATLASTTNITGGTITTTTNLTNLPAIPANWLTAAGIATGAFTSAKFAAGAFDAVWTVTTRTLSAAGVQAIWDALTSALTTAGSIGNMLVTRILGVLASGTHQPQSGDAFARLGAPAGASMSADIAGVQADTNDIQTRLPATLDTGRMRVVVETINANAVNASALAPDAVTEIQSGLATAASQTSIETKIDTIDSIVDAILVDTDSTIPTLLNAIASYIDTEVAAIKTVTDKVDTMLVVDGAVWQLTVNALENAPAGGGGGSGDASQATLLEVKAKTDLITSQSVFVTVDRVSGATITMYYNESTSVTVPIDENTTGLTLRFVVENADGLDVLVIETASITRTSTKFTVTITTAVTATLGQYKWALRDITGGINRLVEGGVLQVQPAANRDA